jgi:hypothetical protein
METSVPLPAIPQRGSPPLPRVASTIPEGVTPKTLLHAQYGTAAETALKRTDFCSCSDNGRAHVKKWTSVLVCPMTGELFLSRPWDEAMHVEEENGVFWFATKNLAEHAAAAWAFNCYRYREWLDSAGGADSQPPPPTLGTIPLSHQDAQRKILDVHEIIKNLPSQLIQSVVNKKAGRL